MTQASTDKGTGSQDAPINTPRVVAAGATVAAVAAAAATGVLNSTTSGAVAATGTASATVTASATGTTSTTGAANTIGNGFSQLWNGSSTGATSPTPNTTTKAAVLMSEAHAVRFLMQASTGFTPEDISTVQSIGCAAWIDQQMAMSSDVSNHVAEFYWSYCARIYGGNPYGKGGPGDKFDTKLADKNNADLDRAMWWRLISPPDTLRQRVALALSEILVINTESLVGVGCYWPYLTAAKYFDLLADNAFGNYGDLLKKVAFHPAMATFLNVVGSKKAQMDSSAVPDENFAREVMQLFTIGTDMLYPDGSEQLSSQYAGRGPNGTALITLNPVPSYTLDDVRELARVFTGVAYPDKIHEQDHAYDANTGRYAMPTWLNKGLRVVANDHDQGAITFLDKTVPAGGAPMARMRQALDILFGHSNVAPFISKQLIQRLVTSNPSPGYVERVAKEFENNGLGVKGDLKAVVRKILLDPEAREVTSLVRYGKVREPMLRFTHWARLFRATSPKGQWITNGEFGMGPAPLKAPSVFNFFRPDYVPDYAPMANHKPQPLVAPELEIANAQSVVAWLNRMYTLINDQGVKDPIPNTAGNYDFRMSLSYDDLGINAQAGEVSLADNASALVNKLSLWLTAGEFNYWGQGTVSLLNGMEKGTPQARLARVKAAMFMAVASPDFIVQK